MFFTGTEVGLPFFLGARVLMEVWRQAQGEHTGPNLGRAWMYKKG
jgi:hypothetical protein